MSSSVLFRSARTFLFGGAATLVLCSSTAIAQSETDAKAPIPDFSSNNISWTAPNSDLKPVPGFQGPGPVTFDPKHPYVQNNQPGPKSYRVADLTHTNLKPWVKDEMRKHNEAVLAGKVGFTSRVACMPGGVPGFSVFVIEPVYMIQTPGKVLLIYQGNHEVRHIYMNVPHSANPKPSWYGESVGHYEGDTLVVDTIGLSTKAFVDNYRIPHTEQLHVVERYRIINDGRQMEVRLTIDDPGAFNEPWQALQIYNRTQQGPLPEVNCAENNLDFFNLEGFFPPPEAKTPDF